MVLTSGYRGRLNCIILRCWIRKTIHAIPGSIYLECLSSMVSIISLCVISALVEFGSNNYQESVWDKDHVSRNTRISTSWATNGRSTRWAGRCICVWCTPYWTFRGKVVWEGLTPFQIIAKVGLQQNPPDFGHIQASIQPICRGCLQKKERHISMSSVLQQLLNATKHYWLIPNQHFSIQCNDFLFTSLIAHFHFTVNSLIFIDTQSFYSLSAVVQMFQFKIKMKCFPHSEGHL